MTTTTMMPKKRLSSLLEAQDDDAVATSDETTPVTRTKNLPPKTHHRITSFDPNIASMSNREIKDRNELAMSVLSSMTTPTTTATHAKRRTAVMVNFATPEDVESVQTGVAIRPEHIVKIFTGNDEVIEVTPEQVKRIKQSKNACCLI